jgi:hypothetical protein
MRSSKRITLAALCLMASATVAVYQHAQSAADLVGTTKNFLVTLSAEQAAKAKFDFADQERMNFHYTPVARKGLPLKEMQHHQRDLVYAMVSAALSRRGAMKANTIMSLEQVLAVLEANPAPAAAPPGNRGNAPAAGAPPQGGNRGGGGGFNRDPELYYVSIFGEPSATARWGWRFEGHHVSVNLTMDKGNYISSAPTFFGANPAEVKEGPRQGLRALAPEEDMGRKLMASLTADQKKTATITKTWQGNDILSAEKVQFDIGSPAGLQASRMTAPQKESLIALIEEYAGRVAPEAAMRTMNEIRANNGLNNVFFAWIGTETRGQAHYYRVHAPSFVIEYENSQNNANHIHSTFRDLKNDFGQDALRAHLILDHGFAEGN